MPETYGSHLQYALAYASRGWAVFPLHNPMQNGNCSCGLLNCASIGKHPRTLHGVKDATKDVHQIELWWNQWPDANVGIATGGISQIIVMDIDSFEGETVVKDICEGEFPSTQISKTSKGYHLFFAHPGGIVKNRVHLVNGLDIRGDGGYVVAPPSRHVSGENYVWSKVVDDIKNLPEGLRTLLLDGNNVNGENESLDVEFDGPIPGGQRNSVLTRYAGSLFGKGNQERDVAGLVHLRNKQKCHPPLSESEVDRIILSIGEREQKKRSSVPSETAVDVVNGSENVPEVALVCLADVETEQITWLWDQRIPFGKVTILDGNPGLGKSTLTLTLAAAVTKGTALPGGNVLDPGTVLMVACEDGIADTIKPRLEAAGGDLSKCLVLEGVYDRTKQTAPLRLPEDAAKLLKAVEDHKVSLLIIDPLLSYVSGTINSHNDQHIRLVMTSLVSIAQKTGAAVLAIRHLRKGEGTAIQRGMGSIGIAAVARSVLLLAADPRDKDARILATVKLNIAHHPPSLRFHIEDYQGIGRILWDGVCEYIADDLVQQESDSAKSESPGVVFLRSFLAGGPQYKEEVLKAAREQGITLNEKTLRRYITEKLKGTLTAGGKSGMWGLSTVLDISDPPDQPVQDVQSVQSPLKGDITIAIPPIGDDVGQVGHTGHSPETMSNREAGEES